MAKVNGEIRFDNDKFLVGDTGSIDELGGIIRGVSLIKTGEAEGHGLQVDDILLKQLQQSGKSKGKVAVQLDHGSGISSTCGFITGFRIDQDKLRGDLHLLKTHPEKDVIIERAARMPECFGLSVAFLPDQHGKKGEPLGGGKYAARCGELKSIDLVCRPAANAGLFSVPQEVDNSKKVMAKEEKKEVKLAEGDTEPTLQEVLAAVQALQGRLDQQDQFNQQIIDHLGGGNEPSLQDLVDASDEELAQLGLTRAEVDAAVQEVLAGMENEGVVDDHTAGQSQGEQQAAGAEVAAVGAGAVGSGVDASPAGASALSALQKEVVQLKNEQKLTKFREKQRAEEVQLKSIEDKVLTLARQRDDALIALEKAEAEIDALKLAVRTGTRPVKAGVDNGMRLFSADGEGELHEFQVRVKQLKEGGKSEAQAIMLAQKENPGLHADWLQSLRNKPATAA